MLSGGSKVDIRIYYEDTDCGGVVYYANYLKYFERARTQYLEDRGFSVAELMKAGRVFVVVHAEVDYRTPARYGDTLEIETTVAEMNAAAAVEIAMAVAKATKKPVARATAKVEKAATPTNVRIIKARR